MYTIHMDLNSYEDTGRHCKLVLRLQKQAGSQKCIANIIIEPIAAECVMQCCLKTGAYMTTGNAR